MKKSCFKKQFLVMAFIAFVFQACSTDLPGITGTYVNHGESEFSIADDTLVVEHQDKLNYLIHRKTGFRLLDQAGKPGDLQYETEEWKAVYDAGSMSMTENRKGRLISFDPGKGLLMLVNSRYQRIN